MSRVFQDNTGNIHHFIDKRVEQIVCIDDEDTNTNILDFLVIWLKLKNERRWYRLFLDARCCFCDMYVRMEDVYLEDVENSPVYYLCDRFSFKDSTITSADVSLFNTTGIK